MKAYYEEDAKRSMEQALLLIGIFESSFKNNNCVVLLMKSYVYNDSAKLYKMLGEEGKYLYYLELSVQARQKLFESVATQYPENYFIVEKMEQEYIVAFSDMCRYETNIVCKRANVTYIKDKLEEWESDLSTLGSLITRIQNNLSKIC